MLPLSRRRVWCYEALPGMTVPASSLGMVLAEGMTMPLLPARPPLPLPLLPGMASPPFAVFSALPVAVVVAGLAVAAWICTGVFLPLPLRLPMTLGGKPLPLRPPLW